MERGSIDDANHPSNPIQFYENNENFVRQPTTNFPRVFQFTGLVANRWYRLSGFIDRNDDQSFDSGEIYAEWEGLLVKDKVDLNILFKNFQPELNFLGQYDDILELAKGESFQVISLQQIILMVIGRGPVVDVNASTPNILPTIVVSGDATDVLEILNNQATVLQSADYGTYTADIHHF